MFKCKKKFAVLCAMVLTLAMLVPMLCFAHNGGEEILYGDANGDTAIDLGDVITLRKYLVNVEGKATNPGTDVDGNGVIDSRDLVVLRQYFANYDYDAEKSNVALGAKKIVYTYTSGDGATTLHQMNADVHDYDHACESLEENGYTEYCTNTVGDLVSTTYTKDDGVVTVTLNGNLQELYTTTSDNGAHALPEMGGAYTVRNETTITQVYSVNDNGMCYIIKLADGSFIIYDGGYAGEYVTDGVHKDDSKNVYNTLVKLNGGEENIHVRAWLITHSHGDHYQVFKYFASNYANKIKLDTVLCSPVASGVTNYDRYLTDTVKTDAAKFGADVAYVRTGMSLQFVDVTLEILVTPEQVYKTGDPGDFNQTSVVSRIKNDDGSMIFLGDCGEAVCNWLIPTYGEALKSDMVQVAHHGCETATTELYDNIAAATVFIPCNYELLISDRGGAVKQHLVSAEYSKEVIIHSYGTATRALSYKSQTEYLNLMPTDAAKVSGSDVKNIRIEDGVLRYEVNSASDPRVYFSVGNLDTMKYNAIKLVVDAEDIKNAAIFFTVSGSTVFSADKCLGFKPLGTAGDDGKMTILLYLGNNAAYKGNLLQLRIDMGDTVDETIDIYSIEAYYVATDK